MDYKLNSNANDDTEFIKPAGVMFVKSSMPSGKAKAILATGTIEKSDKFDGFEICVNDGEYYFPGEFAEEKDKTYRDEENDHFKKNKWNK